MIKTIKNIIRKIGYDIKNIKDILLRKYNSGPSPNQSSEDMDDKLDKIFEGMDIAEEYKKIEKKLAEEMSKEK